MLNAITKAHISFYPTATDPEAAGKKAAKELVEKFKGTPRPESYKNESVLKGGEWGRQFFNALFALMRAHGTYALESFIETLQTQMKEKGFTVELDILLSTIPKCVEAWLAHYPEVYQGRGLDTPEAWGNLPTNFLKKLKFPKLTKKRQNELQKILIERKKSWLQLQLPPIQQIHEIQIPTKDSYDRA